jgi:hypothetical protein
MTAPDVRRGVTFVRTDEPSPMHEVALNLVVTDGGRYVDVYGSAVLIGPGLALTARHNVEIFRANFERARHHGETEGDMQMMAVQTWTSPPATIVHRVRKWYLAPWTDLAVLRLHPAGDQAEPLPDTYRWRAVRLDLLPPPVGATIAAFGYDDLEVTHGDNDILIRARGVTATGLVMEVQEPLHGNAHHGWPRFQTNARFDGGMSGGPVMRDGLACGVVSSSLPANSEDEDHASFVPLLWPAMAIEIDDPRASDLEGPNVPLLELVRAGVVSAAGHELVALAYAADGSVNGISLRHP